MNGVWPGLKEAGQKCNSNRNETNKRAGDTARCWSSGSDLARLKTTESQFSEGLSLWVQSFGLKWRQTRSKSRRDVEAWGEQCRRTGCSVLSNASSLHP